MIEQNTGDSASYLEEDTGYPRDLVFRRWRNVLFQAPVSLPASTSQPDPFYVTRSGADATNYTRLTLNATGSPSILVDSGGSDGIKGLDIGSSNLGNGAIRFITMGTPKWTVERTQGHLWASTDNAPDIGASGASRPRNVYVGTAIFTPVAQLNAATTLRSGSGAPAAGNGVDGDIYFRFDTPGTSLQRIYVRSAGAWVGIV